MDYFVQALVLFVWIAGAGGILVYLEDRLAKWRQRRLFRKYS